jgi:hypothetical protein
MKVVLRSSSLVFTVLCISLDAPIARVKRKAENPLRKDLLLNLALDPSKDRPKQAPQAHVSMPPYPATRKYWVPKFQQESLMR